MVLFNNIKNNFFWIPSILTVVDSTLRLFHISFWVNPANFHFQGNIVWLGVIELIALLLFLLPRTLTIGFFMLCCFWGGLIAINLVNLSFNLFPICMLTLFLIAVYWKVSANNFKTNSDNLNQ